MLGLINQIFIIVMLMLCFGGSFVSINNQKCIVRPTLIDFNLDELYYYKFSVGMNRCDGSCNTVKDLFGRTCASNKIEDVNLKLFNMTKK